MKFNWGHGITIAIVLIMITFTTAFIMSLGHNNDLVTEGYYEKELLFEDEMIKKENALTDERTIDFSFEGEELVISLAKKGTIAKGHILLYRANDKSADIAINALQLDETGSFHIPLSSLIKGKYIIKADWEEGEKSYLVHQTLFVP